MGPSVLGGIANLEPQGRVQIAGSLHEMSAQVSASAGHVMVNNVMDQLVVGNRRFPGATILGCEFFCLLCQPSHMCLADWFRGS